MSFYNFKNITETSAEIEVYGEIVSKRPTNWWGEAIEGAYFISSEFNEQIEKIKNVQNITVKINSPGGDLFVGIGVYNKLKQLNAHITVIVEGIAASAAGLIACAGDVVRLGTGAIIMAHQASAMVPEWYVTESDVEVYKNELEACNKAITEIISAKTGKSVDEIEPLLKEELWLSGQEAIDFGFADEMLDTEETEPFYNASKNAIYSNGKIFAVKNYCSNVKQHITNVEIKNNANTSNNAIDVVANKTKEEKSNMSTPLTLDALKEQHPELVKQIQDEAIKTALVTERQRQRDIDEIGNMIADKDMLNEAKYGDSGISAEKLFYNAGKAQKEMGTAFFNQVRSDYNSSGAEDVTCDPNNGTDNNEVKIEDVVNSAVQYFNKTKED